MVSNPRYGVRVPTEECPAAIIVMSCQCIVGVIIQVHQHDFLRLLVVINQVQMQRLELMNKTLGVLACFSLSTVFYICFRKWLIYLFGCVFCFYYYL